MSEFARCKAGYPIYNGGMKFLYTFGGNFSMDNVKFNAVASSGDSALITKIKNSTNLKADLNGYYYKEATISAKVLNDGFIFADLSIESVSGSGLSSDEINGLAFIAYDTFHEKDPSDSSGSSGAIVINDPSLYGEMQQTYIPGSIVTFSGTTISSHNQIVIPIDIMQIENAERVVNIGSNPYGTLMHFEYPAELHVFFIAGTAKSSGNTNRSHTANIWLNLL